MTGEEGVRGSATSERLIQKGLLEKTVPPSGAEEGDPAVQRHVGKTVQMSWVLGVGVGSLTSGETGRGGVFQRRP